MILLLGGTSDSRELAKSLDAAGHQVLVTTVSEYGGMLAGESGLHQVLTGALDADGLDEMLRQYQVRILVDATHPYAGQISGLAMEAAERAGIRYCRFERKATLMETVEPGCDLHQVENVEQAARQAARLGNNIFLTIGSRGLGDFIRNLPESGLTVTARVLPDLKVMEKCLEMGLQPRNIIAMQGPFSHELNLAMLRDCGAKVLVTKDSGREGGAAAKFSAAGELRIPVVVIDRPKIEYSNMFSDFNGVLEFIKG